MVVGWLILTIVAICLLLGLLGLFAKLFLEAPTSMGH